MLVRDQTTKNKTKLVAGFSGVWCFASCSLVAACRLQKPLPSPSANVCRRRPYPRACQNGGHAVKGNFSEVPVRVTQPRVRSSLQSSSALTTPMYLTCSSPTIHGNPFSPQPSRWFCPCPRPLVPLDARLCSRQQPNPHQAHFSSPPPCSGRPIPARCRPHALSWDRVLLRELP